MPAPFSFTAPARLVDFMRQADEPGLINLAAGIPGLEALPTPELAAALGEAAAREGAKIFAYQHPSGDHLLRELLAERLRSRGAEVQGADILTTTGCTQALQLMISILVQPGDVVACEAPAYYGLLELLAAAKARVLPLPLAGADGIDLAAAEAALKEWKPRCLIVCSSLSNPSGVTLPEANRERLVSLCRGLGVRIIEDDIYAELVDGGAPRPMRAFDDGSTVAYVSSFSKSVAPGLRTGVCVPGTLFEEAATRKCQQDLHGSVVPEMALRYFIGSGALEPHLAALRERNRRRRSLGLAAIERSFPAGTQVTHPQGGYMLWAELPRLIDLTKLRSRARVDRIVFASGDVFFAARPARSYLRLNCAKATEEDLTAGLERLGALLQDSA
ncbi:MAG TPA: PLP-dependent aminotransferase family protein [Chthoniobacteraceae bacterium]|jgi:2-aminoadipate transaminase